MYTNRSYCEKEKVRQINQGDFGKIIKCAVPSVESKRIGIRGSTKYHYVSLRPVDDQAADVGTSPSETMEQWLRLGHVK